jgi:hypothetical protein
MGDVIFLIPLSVCGLVRGAITGLMRSARGLLPAAMWDEKREAFPVK